MSKVGDKLAGGSIVLAAMFMTAAPATADPADFYKGRNVTFVFGFPPGGGYDTYGRTLGRHLGPHLPGGSIIVVQNMPGGGGGMRAANFLYNAAPRDGSVIGMISGATVFEPLFGSDVAKYDTTKFTWVGNMDETTGTCAAWHTAGVDKFDDLFSKEVLFGASGAGSILSQHPAAFRNLFGAKAKVIQGYAGTNEVMLAMQRGEVQASCAMALSSLKTQWPEYWKSGQLKVFVQLGIKKSPDLTGVPHIYDYAKTDEDRQVLDLIFGQHVLGRPLAAPPEVPADRAAALQSAFLKAMQDPAFTAEATKLNLDVAPMSGEAVNQIIAKFFSYPKSVVAKASAATTER